MEDPVMKQDVQRRRDRSFHHEHIFRKLSLENVPDVKYLEIVLKQPVTL